MASGGGGQAPPGGAGQGASAAPEEGEPALHVQMCKKIAQLTKVIYALNMKNDEHEASIQTLKEAHQEEIQHILAETKEAARHYRKKMEKEQELRQRIQTLEEALEQLRPLKKEPSAEFTTIRKQEDKRKPLAESERAKEEISLPSEMLHMKLNSENRVQASNQLSDRLLNGQGPFEGDEPNSKVNLNRKGSPEIWTLIRETEALKRENQKLAKDYAEKASQLQASHERDKETWRKAMQQSLANSCQEWQQRELEQRGDFEAHEAVSQQQMRKLEADLETKSQCISELKKHSQKLKETVQDLEMQLREAQKVIVESKRTVKTLEEELAIAKERLLIQGNEILQKVEAMEKALDSQSKARDEMRDLRSQILHSQQVLSSKQSLRSKDLQPRGSPSVETEALTEQHREERPETKHESDEEKALLKEELVKGLEDLVKKLALELKAAQAAIDVERGKMQKEVQAQLEELKKKHENEIRQVQREKDGAHGKLQDGSQESHDASAQPANVSKPSKGRTKSREKLAALTITRSEGKQSEMNAAAAASRPDSGSALKREDEHSLASFQKEKAKEIQALQAEWSYQKAELQAQEAGKCRKKEPNENFKVQRALQEKTAGISREALGRELKKRFHQQSLLIESLRTELAEQQASCIVHKKEKDELQEELRNVIVLKRQQEENDRNQIQSLKDEMEKGQNEICELKKENALLKDTVELLRADVALLKQTSGQLQEPEGQHRRFKEVEETARKREPRPEDLHLISCLQEKLNEKEEMIKELMDGRKLQPPLVSSTEPHRNRSFSFNANPSTCLAPIAKKKKMDDMPSRIVSVPNLASYAKSFLSGDLRPKRNPPQITKSTSLDQNPGCVRVCYPPAQVLETKLGPCLQSNETAKPKDAQKLDPRPQEWFTKYFSF